MEATTTERPAPPAPPADPPAGDERRSPEPGAGQAAPAGHGADPPVGRAAAVGAALGCLASVVGIAVAGTASGMDPGGALGLGAFVGIWGGAGFGFMMGATLTLARHEDAARAARSTGRR